MNQYLDFLSIGRSQMFVITSVTLPLASLSIFSLFLSLASLTGLVGHQPTDEKPWCWNETSESWHLTEGSAVLDTTDSKNDLDGPQYIDRHDCVFMDVNGDTFPDILCSVGANSGKGHGFNEVYLTLPDGGLVKILENGLQKYTTMRNRLMVRLRIFDGATCLYLMFCPKASSHIVFSFYHRRRCEVPMGLSSSFLPLKEYAVMMERRTFTACFDTMEQRRLSLKKSNAVRGLDTPKQAA
jgi:hypothetical protein